MKDAVIILLLAIVIDVILGEPPNALHPVVWMGRWIGWGERHAPDARPLTIFIYGMLIVVLGLLVAAFIALGASSVLKTLNSVAYVVFSAWLLKTTFAYKALVRAAREVQSALRSNDLDEARRRLAWHLVSRDTKNLNCRLVAAATIESVAENFGDGIVVPLFYFVLFGLPGAIAYRFVNTADAMLAYHDSRREYLGKFAARLDDVLNLIPSRLAALVLLLSATVSRSDVSQAWRVMWRDHARTASPNAGWPMSTMAGALDVTLEKVSHYRLGNGAGALNADTITRSLRLLRAATVIYWCLLVLCLQVLPSCCVPQGRNTP